MTWVAVAIAGSSIVTGLLGKSSQDSAAKKARKSQKEDIALRREGLDFSKEQYADWKAKYDPMYAKTLEHIEDGTTPDYNAIDADVNTAFGVSRDANRRQMMRYGIRPQDGAFMQGDRQSRTDQAAASVGTRNQARQATAGLKYARYADLHNSLQGIGSNLASNVQSGYQNAAQGYGQLASMQERQGIQSANSWNNLMNNVGTSIGAVDWSAAWQDAKGWFGGGNGITYGAGTSSPPGGYAPNSGQQGPPAPSDVRLKDSIKHLYNLGKIKIYEWTWNAKAKELGLDNHRNVGILANEHLDSEFVTVGSHGYLQVDYDGLFGSVI